MTEALTTLSSNTIIENKYRITRVIGTGGMGTVYEAAVLASGHTVAIKVLHEKYCHVPEVVSRFHREARLATAIGHDNICEVIDLGTLPSDLPFLVMPLLRGRPLSSWLKSDEAPLLPSQISSIICQTLSALMAAHKAGIVHRDLKPDNIFVNSNSDGDVFVKLLDFGISKLVSNETGSVYTKEGTVIGTPAYMAPEQAKGAKEIDHRIDIYAMGVILYEVLTGRRPYSGSSTNELVFKIIGEPFLAPRRINPQISLPMEQVILQAMAKDPAQRFSSAQAMKQAFELAATIDVLPLSRETSAPTAVTMDNAPFQSPDETDPIGPPEDAAPLRSRAVRTSIFVVAAVVLLAVAVFLVTRFGL